MTQPGAPAALKGYRLQALYTLGRIFAPGIDGTHLFQPEGTEDLDILDQDGVIVEAIQIKSYSRLTLSDLEPGEGKLFSASRSQLIGRRESPGRRAGELRRYWS